MASFSEEELKQLLGEFLRESRENLDGLDGRFIELEAAPGDREIIKDIFRRMHTVKGGSGFVGLKQIEKIAHAAEEVLTHALDDGLQVTAALTSALLKAVDAISQLLGRVETSGAEGEAATLVQDVKAALHAAQNPAAAPAPEPAAAAPEPVPGENQNWGLFDDEPAPAKAAPAPAATPAAAVVAAAPRTEAPAPKAEAAEPAPAPDAAKSAAKEGVVVESSVRIDVNLLDKLMNLVGELVLARNQIVQFTAQSEDAGIVGSGHRLSLVTTELQENIMKTRMQPIGTVFTKFPRIIRDLAVATGKKLQLEIEGQETELDRTIVDSIRDPLVHIIRNSVDHGIEMPNVRQQRGKPPEGRVFIRAFHEGGQVNIAISDDGAGINVAKVKAKAVERGLITAAEAAVMSDSQARMLIFAAGLSTAEQVTNISGRGVGMDVVRSSVERIGGTIELDSELGKGTTIRIRIPLTLAIIPALIVGTGNEMFAIPQVNLHELVRLEADDSRRAIEQVQGADVYRLRGKLLPLVRLRDVLQIKADKPADDSCNILVLNLGQTQFGLLVDQVFDTEEIVVKPLSRHLKKLGCYAGATIMGDGRVALILDAEGLLRRSRMAVHTDKGRETRSQGSREGRTDAINMLVFSLGADDRFAVPLTLVNRLEEFEAARVERIGTREVIQYRDDILPLFDVAGMLDVEPPVPDDNGMWSVVVVTLENRSVGIKVRRIIDVAESTANFSRSAGTRAGVLGAGIMQGRTTVYLDLFRLVRDAARDLFEDTTVRAAPLTGLSALVVDDSRFFRTLEASYLEAEGMQVEQCADSGKALELIAEHSFDLLVFDIEMPGMDGVELTSRVRALAGMAERPILVVSGALDEVNRKRVEEAGATGYRSKLEHKSFLDGVRQVLKARAGAGA